MNCLEDWFGTLLNEAVWTWWENRHDVLDPATAEAFIAYQSWYKPRKMRVTNPAHWN